MKSPLDVSELFAKAQQMQSKVAQLQQELARRSFEGSAGGGMVTAVATATFVLSRFVSSQASLRGGIEK